MPEIDAGILIGGQSKRFGRDKASLRFGDFTLLERIYHAVHKSIDNVWIIGKKQGVHELPSELFVDDIITNAGPMGGLLTALKTTNKPTLIVSCDSPFIESDHITYLMNQYESLKSATIAVSDRGIEPLFGIYNPILIKRVEKLIAEGNLALYRIFEYEQVKFVDFSKEGNISNLFFNINTLSDYKKALYLRQQAESKIK